MTARDVMRSAAVDPGHIVGERQLGETLPRWQVRAILTALSEAGYSIVHESEIHGATVDRFRREIARLLPHYQSQTATDAGRRQLLEHFDEFAIRALPDGGVE